MKKQVVFALFLLSLAVFFSRCGNQPSTQPNDEKNDSTDVTKNWKLGVQMWTFRMFSFAEALDKVDSAGVKNIEAFFGQPLGAGLKDSFGTNMSTDSRARLKQILQSKGIQIVAMGVIEPKGKDEWVKAFDLAKEFGLSYITAEPRKIDWGIADSLAGVYGINIAIHDHPRPNNYWSPDSVLAAISGHSHIGSCADVGHWARNGLNPVDCLKKLEGHIFGVHLKDIVKFDDTKAEDTLVGKGVIEFAPIFQELKRQKFAGMFSIEHESNWYHSVPDVIETVKFYNDQVAKLK
jgi:sugar phosphate isomerase/epimerase